MIPSSKKASVNSTSAAVHNGTTFNTYYYLRNAWNDVIKLIDKTGATVVEYAHLNSGSIAVKV